VTDTGIGIPDDKQTVNFPTRQLIEPQLLREWHRSVSHNVSLTCAVLDVDRFQEINDRWGLSAGDSLLKEISTVIHSYSRVSDFFCRLSGDSFLLVLTDCNEQDAANCVDRVREAVETLSLSHGEETLRATVSIGVAQRYHDTNCFDDLLKMAEQALRVAKEMGRNRVTRHRRLCGDSDRSEFTIDGTKSCLLIARDVMTSPIVCLRDSASAREAARFMTCRQLTSIPVVDDKGLLAGILSEKDLLTGITDPRTAEEAIRDLMTTDVVCFREEELAQSICAFLSEASIRRVIIANEGRPTGIISRGTLLRHFCELETENKTVEPTLMTANEPESDNELAARIALECGALVGSVENAAQANESSPETLST
jgi:diguanylate cyclase (GGDEF)-like protein